MNTVAIPVIDLGALNADAGNLPAIAAQIHAATSGSGFFYIRNHAIDNAVIAQAVRAAELFFAHPTHDKQTIAVNQHNRGFMAVGASTMRGATAPDLKEVFFWGRELQDDDPDKLAGKPLAGPNQWPVFMPSLRTSIEPYYRSVLNCGAFILEAIAIALGLDPAFFERRYYKPLARGQLIFYPPRTGQSSSQFGVAPHSDFGCITLLLQDDNGGLQIRERQGRWIDADPIPGTLVVNIGDLLQRWSNERLVSTTHRVINRSGNKRHSIAVFCDPDIDTLIDPRDMALPAGAAVRYEPITAGDYIMARNRQSFAHYAN